MREEGNRFPRIMRTTFTTCISHPLSPSFLHYSHTLRDITVTPYIYIYIYTIFLATTLVHSICVYMCLHERPRILRPYSGRKFMRVSLSACFRRSELLGCMTLPLPLSQDKVNITKLRVYIRNVRSRDIHSQFTSSVHRIS